MPPVNSIYPNLLNYGKKNPIYRLRAKALQHQKEYVTFVPPKKQTIMEETERLGSIQDYNQELGVETLHPLINVVDMSTIELIRHGKKQFGFYCVFLKDLSCGTLAYGRSRYDYQEGTMVFIAPGQVAGVNDNGVTMHPKGWILMFHPDLLYGTSLAKRMKDYTFFAYDSNEALHMSERERHIILNCLSKIREELEHATDKHTKHIIASNIETLLNHCVRFYERQFTTREIPNHRILVRFEQELQAWFDSDKPHTTGLPTVQWFAEQVCLSPNYFGDLVKKETGHSAKDYIQHFVVERAKTLLAESDKTISEIAYEIGFKYPHHLNRVFKKVTGRTPNTYRTTATQPPSYNAG